MKEERKRKEKLRLQNKNKFVQSFNSFHSVTVMSLPSSKTFTRLNNNWGKREKNSYKKDLKSKDFIFFLFSLIQFSFSARHLVALRVVRGRKIEKFNERMKLIRCKRVNVSGGYFQCSQN